MSLLKKSLLTSLTKAINIILNFIVQLIITPIILAGLGQQLFGVYTLINRIQGYLSLADLRPSAILRFKLASLQTSMDSDLKKRLVGTTLILSLLSLPVMIVLGYLFSIYFHQIFIIDEIYIEIASITILIFSIFISFKSVLAIPESIVRGNNLEYKLFFIDPIRMILYSILVYFLIEWGYSLLGVVYAIIIAGIFDYLLKFIMQLRLLPGYFPKLPDIKMFKSLFKSSSLYLGSSFNQQLYISYEIVLIGYLYGMKEVTIYSLTKAILYRVAESISTITSGITSSIGNLISSKSFEELIKIRLLLFRINMIISFIFISYFLIFNSSFVSLWVGKENFIGINSNIVFCITAIFIIFTFSDEIFINSFELFSKKMRIFSETLVIGVLISFILSFNFSLLGIAIGFLFSKLYQFIRYQFVLNNYVEIDYFTFFKKNLLFIIFQLCLIISCFFNLFEEIILINGWIELIYASCLYFILVLVLIYIFLESDEKSKIKEFVQRKFLKR